MYISNTYMHIRDKLFLHVSAFVNLPWYPAKENNRYETEI